MISTHVKPAIIKMLIVLPAITLPLTAHPVKTRVSISISLTAVKIVHTITISKLLAKIAQMFVLNVMKTVLPAMAQITINACLATSQ